MTLAISRPSQMLRWLAGSAVVSPNGAVASWFNPRHPGYPYPEIAGYLLRILSEERDLTLGLRDRIAVRLGTDVSPAGGVGRGGADFVFDSAMCLSGLMAHEEAGGAVPGGRLIDRLFDFIAENLAARRAFLGQPHAPADHWSVSYGCHLLKAVIALCEYNDRRPMSTTKSLVDRLVADLLPLYDNGRFRANDLSPLTYLHAHCYAVEGLLVLQGRRRFGDFTDEIEGAARWLAEIQQPEGGVRAYHDGTQALGTIHTDASAQAIRIWSLVDPSGFRRQIDLGLEFLGAMSTPSGGLRYEPDSDDLNTWATIFGLQAVRFANEGGSWEWIV
jgi:hypothetical protein